MASRKWSGVVHHGPIAGMLGANAVGSEVLVTPAGHVTHLGRAENLWGRTGFRGILLKIKGDTAVVQLTPSTGFVERMTVGNLLDTLKKIAGE
jgi:hypothetical protein